MKLLFLPENPAELFGLAANLVPLPLAHTQLFSLAARAIYDATEAGIFEALAAGPLDAAAIAKACGLDRGALEALLGLLAAGGYLRQRQGRFALAPKMRKWLLADGPSSIRDQLLFMRSVWSWLDAMPTFLRSGKGIRYHESFGPEQWELYQRGMEAVARGSAAEVARKTPLPRDATAMLDIGGSHGLYSVALCRRHKALASTILELPAAVDKARPLLARHGMGQRVRFEAGNALDWEMGEGRYDLVFVSSLMHHLSREDNRALAGRIARALKPGGFFAIQEFIRPQQAGKADIVGSILNLFFAFTSMAGTWSEGELEAWQAEAGLVPHKVIGLVTMPGFRQIVARRPLSPA
jgi:SAM-dependent methyltransferase